MKKSIIINFLLIGIINMMIAQQKFGIVIHGGAGNILPEHFTKELEQQYHQALNQALNAGYTILEKGGSAVDAVTAAIKILEDNPLFNAGKGSVYNQNGQIEMDASIMEGKEMKAGAVAGVRKIKNPIEAAKLVMEQTPHVLLIGQGAEKLWVSEGLELVDTSYFYDEKRFKQWKQQQQNKSQQKHGTVGAVALDKKGNLAAGTSTGGMMDKMPGRVGDSPIIGAGTYACDKTCAISCTGHGEFFIRFVVAHTIHSKMLYQNKTLQQATHEVLFDELLSVGGKGGVIGIDKNANIVMDFNTTGMYRGFKLSDGSSGTFIFSK